MGDLVWIMHSDWRSFLHCIARMFPLGDMGGREQDLQ